jgi:hypothetical protein
MGEHRKKLSIKRVDLSDWSDVPREAAAPEDWVLGQLLDVRQMDGGYVVTLLGEPYDQRKPERALTFPNSAACQNFVSAWYAKTYDPKAV